MGMSAAITTRTVLRSVVIRAVVKVLAIKEIDDRTA